MQQNLYHERQMNYRAFAERPSVQQELDEAVEDVDVEPTERGASCRSAVELGSPHDQKQEGDVHGLEQASGRRARCRVQRSWTARRGPGVVLVVAEPGLPGAGRFAWKSGCSSLAFSAKRPPHLLAVGLVDGAVYIYDVRQKTLQPTPVFDS